MPEISRIFSATKLATTAMETCNDKRDIYNIRIYPKIYAYVV